MMLRLTRSGYLRKPASVIGYPRSPKGEYAACSGDKQKVWAGPSDETQLGDYAVYLDKQGNRTAPVGEHEGRKSNEFGLYDMSGNVCEWVEDCFHGNYQNAPVDGSTWLETEGGDCGDRVLRGGSWGGDPGSLRSSLRPWDTTLNRNSYLGFRLVQGTP